MFDGCDAFGFLNATGKDWGCISRKLVRTTERTFSSGEKDGFTCYDLARNSTTLQVLPPDFLPEELCACLPGWNGTGAKCTKCPTDTFKPKQGAGYCTPCPSNTTTRNKLGSISEHDCHCKEAFHRHQGGKVVDARLDLIRPCERAGSLREIS